MSIKDQIRAEIERRMDKHWDLLPNADSPEDDWTHNELCELGAFKELEYLETFLDTHSEQPASVDLEKDFEKEIDKTVNECTNGYDFDWEKFARHFYELGCRRTAMMYDDIEYKRQIAEEDKLSGDLEEEIERVCAEIEEKNPQHRGLKPSGIAKIARHFAEWGAEHAKQKPADDKAFEEWLDDWYQGSKEAGGDVVMSEAEFKNWSRGIKNMYQQKPAWSGEQNT